ncbi:MAG: hypothetical protein J0M10_15110 [Chitinophagales bacterium]|nr:hypothetical protein [Chitinophagales bacterium]
MKQVLTALFSILLFTANAQTADEIVQKNIQSMGGLELLSNITTYKITGNVTGNGVDMPLTTQVINGKSFRTDIDVMGQSIVMVYHNGAGWTINPFTGATEATDITGAQLYDLKSQAGLVSNLMDYKNRGHQLELQGTEEVEGVKTYKLRLTAKEDGRVFTYFISQTDFTVVKSVTKREIQGQEIDVENYFSNYKVTDGVKFAFSRSQKVEGQVLQEMHIEKVELNIPLDEAIFKK